ncbi:MAG: hypothetical protein KAH72_05830 [Flavobacteriaceae bacterium]|nr:hypothetical protein [Flavobacteriaceae bacterium]
MKLFGIVFGMSEFKKLKVGDVLAEPENSPAAQAGFIKYAKIKNYYKIVDINENGIICNRYLSNPFESLPAGFMFKDAFYDANFVNRWLKEKQFIITDGTELQTILDKDK